MVIQNQEHVVSKMPIKEGMLNPFGTIHAGAMIWLADVTATILGMQQPGEGFPVAVNLFTNLLSNQKGGELTAEARVTRSGKRVIVIRTTITGHNDKLLIEVFTTHIRTV